MQVFEYPTFINYICAVKISTFRLTLKFKSNIIINPNVLNTS
jgi:hypothetical protein